jgi:hypothetical protein
MNTAQVSCGPSSLDELRRRGVFLFSCMMWAACGGFALIAFGYLIFLANNLLAFVGRLRTAVGGQPQLAGPDWVLIATCVAIGILPVVGLGLCWRWYRRQWNSRLAAVWVSSDLQQRHCRIGKLPVVSAESDCRRKVEYLRDLLTSPQWSSHRTSVTAAVNVDPDKYRSAVEAVLLDIEKDVAERAIATGLIVGISSNGRMDSLTILLAAFEIQMHVLSRLGKRPSLRMWVELFKRCGASLFFNTYLNRQETMGVSFAIKQAGLGVHAAGEILGEGGHALSDFDVNDALDQLLGDHGLPETAKLAISAGAMAAGLGMGVGGVGLRVIGQAIESIGDELLQGVLAGAALYFHGMALASECLALDAQHRNSAAMTRTFRDGLGAVTKTAAAILREQVKSRTDAYRERRRMALKLAPKQMGADAWGVVRGAFSRKPKADIVTGS